MSREILKGTAKVSLLTLISRALGFVWNLLMASTFGAGLISDVFFIAYRIPNLLRSFLAEGALTSAFVPVFAEDLNTSKEKAQETLSSMTSIIIITAGLLTSIGMIFAPSLVQLIAPGYEVNSKQYDLCVQLTRISLPYIFFVSLVSLINGSLNNLKIYGASPVAQISMNCVLIAACWLASFYDPELGIYLLTISVLIGGAVQVLVQLPALKRVSLSILPSKQLLTKSTKKIIFLMIPAILGAAVYQLNIIVNTMLASTLQSGSISWLFYADRITQLPIGIITIALASVLLPNLSKNIASGDNEKFTANLSNSLRYLSFLMIPASVALFALAEPITRLFFERGEFSSFDSSQTYLAIQAICFGIWGFSCYSIVVRAFLARQNTTTPALLGVCTLVFNLCIALLLMGPISSVGTTSLTAILSSIQSILYDIFPHATLGHLGLALSGGLSISFSFLIAVYILRRTCSWSIKTFLIASIKSLIAALAMLFWIQFLSTVFASNLAIILISIPTGAAIYAFCILLLKSTEAKETFSLIKRKYFSGTKTTIN